MTQYRGLTTKEDEEQTQVLAVLPASLETLGLKYLERDALRARFSAYDRDGSGGIDVLEARQLLVDAGATETSMAAAKDVVDAMDVNGNGRVEFADFKAAVDRAAEPVSSRVWPISGWKRGAEQG